MKQTFTFLAGMLCAFCVNAQTGKYAIKYDQPYGVIDTADLAMQQCDFEKDAHAEILSDFLKVDFEWNYIRVDHHLRMKIFDRAGEKYAVVRIPVFKGGLVTDDVRFLKAQTINLSGKDIITTPVENKYIYKEKTNQYIETLCISLPDIQPGSVFEVTYSYFNNSRTNYPKWFPQGPIPVRYSQIIINENGAYFPAVKIHVSLPFAADTAAVKTGAKRDTRTFALANIPSYKKEEYSGFVEDGVQYAVFLGLSPTNASVIRNRFISSFHIGTIDQLLTDTMITQLYSLNNKEDKITYIFNAVKNRIKWNGKDNVAAYGNFGGAWQTQIGSSTEINMVLYEMLMQTGIKCYPLVVSTHNYPRVDFSNLYKESFNRTVVYVPVDNNQNYILDATSKYNNYKQTPVDLLDLQGLIINESNKPLQVASMNDNQPAMQTVFIEAGIKADGKMSGSATIAGYSYNKILIRQDIDTSKDDVYKDHLTGGDHNLKITSLKFENMDVDTLPLIQHIDFDYDPGDAEGGYIYFKPNLFSPLQKNPFINDKRISDVYFGYRRFYNITGNYKLPAGYKIDAAPKNTSIIMPDSGIIFKRFVGVQDDGSIQVRYSLHFNKSIFPVDEYPALYEFYRKMYEALNEQVVLKKL